MSIRVLVADDHEVVRSGLSSLLQGSEIEVVAEASTGDQAVEQTITHDPDVVLMDIRMPDTDGLAALERIRSESPQTRVVMLSTYDNPTYVARSVALGDRNHPPWIRIPQLTLNSPPPSSEEKYSTEQGRSHWMPPDCGCE